MLYLARLKLTQTDRCIRFWLAE